MKNILNIVTATSLLSVGALHAVNYEFNKLYKDTRIMGMGGANIARGGESSALFNNPAGLSGISQSDGLELELVNITASLSDNFISIGQDVADSFDTVSSAIDEEDYGTVLSNIPDIMGVPLSLGVNDYSSVAYRGKTWAFSVGVLAGMNMVAELHNPLGSAGLIELNAFTSTAAIAGFSLDLLDDRALHVGFGMKYFLGETIAQSSGLNEEQNITSVDMVVNANLGFDTDFGAIGEDYMSMAEAYSAVAFDIGAIYDLDALVPNGDFLHPSVGASIMNIGQVAIGDNVVIPMTVNVGGTIRPEIQYLDWFLTDLEFSADYTDLFYAYDGASILKRLSMGARGSLLKGFVGELTASTGFYNGAMTWGMQTRFTLLEVSYASYVEQLGVVVGQNQDRRHQVSVALGW